MTNLSDAKWAEFRNVHSLCVIFLWSQFLQFFCRRKWNSRAAGICKTDVCSASFCFSNYCNSCYQDAAIIAGLSCLYSCFGDAAELTFCDPGSPGTLTCVKNNNLEDRLTFSWIQCSAKLNSCRQLLPAGSDIKYYIGTHARSFLDQNSVKPIPAKPPNSIVQFLLHRKNRRDATSLLICGSSFIDVLDVTL